MISWLLFGSFFVLLMLNIPIAISLASAAAIALLASGGFSSLTLLPNIMYSSITKFTLLAIPFFILAGTVMEYAGISKRLIHFADVLVGHRKGGIALVTVLTAIFFSGISGSGPADVAALGSILIPALVKNGYPKSLASGLMASSGSIGVVIPPSITFIVFADVAGDQINVSIGRLFVAGIVPGILLGVSFIVASMIMMAKKEKAVLEEHGQSSTSSAHVKASSREVIKAFIDALWGILVPIIILGGIYGGVFTPTEAAVVAVFYGFFVGIFAYKELKMKDIINILVDSSTQTAVVMFIVGAASVFTYIITTEQIANAIAQSMLAITHNKIVLLLFINVLLLIAGAFIDSISAMYLFIPILLPIILHLHVDPTVFGVFLIVNLAIGLFTPPVGVNLYVACGISKISLKEISSGIGPFVISALVVLALVTYIPAISTWLPNLLGAK